MKPISLSSSFWLGIFLFSVYLLSFSGKLHVMDELAVFTAGNNLAQYGRADINQLIWTQHWTPNPPGIWGQDGNLYTKKAPGISFITAPLLWLGHTLPGLNATHVGLLTNVFVTALTASLLFIWLTDVGFSRFTATLTSLGYGLCTIAWVYARMFWELSILGLCFLVAIWAAGRVTAPAHSQRKWPWLLLCGSAVALGLTLRFETAVAIIFLAAYLLANRRIYSTNVNEPASNTSANPASVSDDPIASHASRITSHVSRLWHRIRPAILPLVIYLIPSALVGLGLAYFNFVRYGSLGETGYSQEILFLKPWVGGYGLLFSPGNGLFIYSPFMLLLFFGLRPAWRRLPRAYFWLISALCLFYWIFYGSWFAWGGVWVWGPRFFLPTLPLLMLFVAETLEWAQRGLNELAPEGVAQQPTADTRPPGAGSRRNASRHHSTRFKLAWLGISVLAILSLVVNFLGIAVDFNEHFLRLGRNDNFTFNWAAFPPLGHWRILKEGLVDIIWLRPQAGGPVVEWSVLTPALVLLAVATVGLVLAIREPAERPGKWARFSAPPLTFVLVTLLALGLTYQMMTATARVALANEQTQADLPVLELLTSSAEANDVLLIPMPPFGDVQEMSVLTMSYLDRSLPTFAWIESEPRAIQPDERERVWQIAQAQADRTWLFERWLTPNDPPTVTATRLNQEAFPVFEQWFERSGKLTLYSLHDVSQPATSVPVVVPFQGGLRLRDFTIFGAVVEPGEILKVRLTWQAPVSAKLAAKALPADGIVGFVHLLDDTPAAQKLAQQDRLLLDLQNVKQSPLLPGQTVQQGYGLRLPDDLAPGSYSLIAGVYLATTGQRLPRADGSPDDFLYLTNITVP